MVGSLAALTTVAIFPVPFAVSPFAVFVRPAVTEGPANGDDSGIVATLFRPPSCPRPENPLWFALSTAALARAVPLALARPAVNAAAKLAARFVSNCVSCVAKPVTLLVPTVPVVPAVRVVVTSSICKPVRPDTCPRWRSAAKPTISCKGSPEPAVELRPPNGPMETSASCRLLSVIASAETTFDAIHFPGLRTSGFVITFRRAPALRAPEPPKALRCM
mmetsp:Transcript_52693/g.104678  ORF Transcript_52693/g.104678 Transcript_52693/m.104678 type:complete len:219 (+) Transcript_52693:276-932(+)